jgi:hypothetical protein
MPTDHDPSRASACVAMYGPPHTTRPLSASAIRTVNLEHKTRMERAATGLAGGIPGRPSRVRPRGSERMLRPPARPTCQPAPAGLQTYGTTSGQRSTTGGSYACRYQRRVPKQAGAGDAAGASSRLGRPLYAPMFNDPVRPADTLRKAATPLQIPNLDLAFGFTQLLAGQ